MCGSVQVILPSQYSGAELCISHDHWPTKRWDMSPRSGESTFIVASRNDVTYTLNSVTSGYRLSLVYKLVARPSPGTSLRLPVTPDMTGVQQKLRDDLRSWQSEGYKSESESGSDASESNLADHGKSWEDLNEEHHRQVTDEETRVTLQETPKLEDIRVS